MRPSLLAMIVAAGLGAPVGSQPLTGVPSVDYAVGRTNTTPMSIAYLESKPLVNFSTSNVQIPNSGTVGSVTFIVSSAYTGTFSPRASSAPGSWITLVSTSTINAYIAGNGTTPAASTVGYIFGEITAWDPGSRALTIEVEGTSGTSAKSVAFYTGVKGTTFLSPAGQRGQSFSDWQLNQHVPAWSGANAVGEVLLFNSAPGSIAVTDWDFSKAKCSFGGSTVSTTTNSIDFLQCKFNVANMGANSTAPAYFNFSSLWSIRSCSGYYDWRSMAVTATVTQIGNVGDLVLNVDQVPTQHPDFLTISDSPAKLINNAFRIINTTNPSSMSPAQVCAVDAASKTITVQQFFRVDSRDGSVSTKGTTSYISSAGTNKLYLSSTATVYIDSQAFLSSIVGGQSPSNAPFYGNVTGTGTDGNGPYALLDRNLATDIPVSTIITFFSTTQGWPFSVAPSAAAATGQNVVYMPTTKTVNGGLAGTTVVPTIIPGTSLGYKNPPNTGTPYLLGIVASVGSDSGGAFVVLDRTLPFAITTATTLYVLPPTIKSSINVGDTLTFFPQFSGYSYNVLNVLINGPCTLWDLNDFDAPNDWLNAPPAAGVPLAYKRSRISMMGLNNTNHADVFQHYASPQNTPVEIGNLYICWGYPIGDKALASQMGWGNPRDVTPGQKGSPLMADINMHDIIFDNTPDGATGTLLYDSDENSQIVLGTRASPAGKTRVTFSNYAGKAYGNPFTAGDIFSVGGSSNSALSGNFPILGGAPSYTSPLRASTTFLSPQSGNKIYFGSASITANGYSTGVLLYSSTNPLDNSSLLGSITGTGTDGTGTYVTIDTPLAVDISAGTTVTALQWMDIDVPFVGETRLSLSSALTGAVGSTPTDTITVASTAGVQLGMLVGGSVNFTRHTYVKQILSSTQIQLTRPTQNVIAAGTNVTFCVWFNPCVVALKRIANIKIGYRLQETDGEDQFLFPSSMQAGLSIENITDLTTGQSLTFKVYPYESGPVVFSQQSYHPQLPAPTVPTVAKVASGSIQISFPAVSGAVSYAYSLDGGTTWSNDRIAGTGYIQPGDTITGLSPGNLNVVVRAMNAVNDCGFPVNPGVPSSVQAFALAA